MVHPSLGVALHVVVVLEVSKIWGPFMTCRPP